jgi:hypothetical protein
MTISCKQCNKEFLTRPEEEKMMVTGAIAQVCMECAMVGMTSQEEDPRKYPMPPLGSRRRFKLTDILRADLRDPTGEVFSFIAQDPGPYYSKPRERKKVHHMGQRPNVQILGNPSTGCEPDYVAIISNFKNFEKEDRDLFVMKIPDIWSPTTGIGEIRIKRRKVDRLERAENGMLAWLKDGWSVAAYYPVNGEYHYIPFPIVKS